MAGLAGVVLDHFRLDEEIGRGGMATVCRGIDLSTEEEVAVKVLSPTISGDSRFVRRFRREAGLLAHLEHPNIVPVTNYGESKGMVYLVMPFVHGDTLQERLEQGKVKVQEGARWMGQVADALDFAHNRGIIHRDVKPSNVIIDKRGDAQLMDFGLAREVEGSNTLTGSMLMGTPAYMSPEQGRGGKVDTRSDQYSVGVILYQMVTGRLPFEADSPMGTVLMHIQETVPRPSRFARKLSPAVERVILKSLAKDPEFRYPTAGALVQAFQAALDGASLEELDLTTTVPSLGRSLREYTPPYLAPQEEPTPKRRGRSVWVFLLAIPLLVAAGLAAYPRLSTFLEGTGPAPTQVPVVLPPVSPTVAFSASPELPTPSATPRPTPMVFESCPGLKFYPPELAGNNLTFTILNERSEELTLRQIDLQAFPLDNGELEKVVLGDGTFWQGGSPGGIVTPLPTAQTAIRPSAATTLLLRFTSVPLEGDYTVELDFGETCQLRLKLSPQ